MGKKIGPPHHPQLTIFLLENGKIWWNRLCRHMCQKISASADGGLSRGSRVCGHGREDPHQHKRNYFYFLITNQKYPRYGWPCCSVSLFLTILNWIWIKLLTYSNILTWAVLKGPRCLHKRHGPAYNVCINCKLLAHHSEKRIKIVATKSSYLFLMDGKLYSYLGESPETKDASSTTMAATQTWDICI